MICKPDAPQNQEWSLDDDGEETETNVLLYPVSAVIWVIAHWRQLLIVIVSTFVLAFFFHWWALGALPLVALGIYLRKQCCKKG